MRRAPGEVGTGHKGSTEEGHLTQSEAGGFQEEKAMELSLNEEKKLVR